MSDQVNDSSGSIRSESKEGKARLWFEDNGIGIEPEAHQKSFEMFQHGGGTRNMRAAVLASLVCAKRSNAWAAAWASNQNSAKAAGSGSNCKRLSMGKIGWNLENRAAAQTGLGWRHIISANQFPRKWAAHSWHLPSV